MWKNRHIYIYIYIYIYSRNLFILTSSTEIDLHFLMIISVSSKLLQNIRLCWLPLHMQKILLTWNLIKFIYVFTVRSLYAIYLNLLHAKYILVIALFQDQNSPFGFLIHFKLMIHFYTPWKYQKTSGFIWRFQEVSK